MDTKLKGDIAEQAVTLYALKNGWGVLKPIGDRHPYDLVLDINGVLIKLQVKYAWFNEQKQSFVVDNRRTKTNRRTMIRLPYLKDDFDFAVIYLEEKNIFYVLPVEVFIGYGSEIHFIEAAKRQRKPLSSVYRDAWHLILQRAVPLEIVE